MLTVSAVKQQKQGINCLKEAFHGHTLLCITVYSYFSHPAIIFHVLALEKKPKNSSYQKLLKGVKLHIYNGSSIIHLRLPQAMNLSVSATNI